MKRKTQALIVLGVIVAHVVGFLLLGQLNAVPKVGDSPNPDFSAKTRAVVDGAIRQRAADPEFRVGTKLAAAAELNKAGRR